MNSLPSVSISLQLVLLFLTLTYGSDSVLFPWQNGRLSQQPWPVKIEEIALCCQIMDNNRGISHSNSTILSPLKGCINQYVSKVFSAFQNSDKASVYSKLTIVTFSDPGDSNDSFSVADIEDFSIYQRAIVSAYAEQNKYLFHPITISDDHGIDFGNTSDYRWLKIKLLRDALDGWARHTEFIVWIGINTGYY